MVEFYDGKKLVTSVASTMVPPVSSYINIRKKTWLVVSVTYAVDHADQPEQYRVMRANVDLKEADRG